MYTESKNGSNHLKSVLLVSLLTVCASERASAASPLVQCQPTNVDGVPVCAVDMASYAQTNGVGPVACPTGVSSTGTALLCEQSFAAAINDAKLFFTTAGEPSEPYVITIGAGAYDLSSQTTTLAGLYGVIDATGIAPTSAGCLTGTAPLDGTVALSGNPCLVIKGAGPGATLVTTATGFPAIFGKAVSHVMFEDMTMIQPNLSTSEGTYVDQGTTTVQGIDYPTVTLDVAPGFPTPLALYKMNCTVDGRDVCSEGRLSRLQKSMYLRAFSNSASPQLIMSTAGSDTNGQDPWGYPGSQGAPAAAVAPTRPDPTDFPNRWTLTMSLSAHARGIPSYYSATTGGEPNLVCMKVDYAQAFWFDDIESGGTDIIMNNMAWVGAGRGTFRGVSGEPSGGGLGAQVYNSSIERGPPVQGQPRCLATESGGLQFGQPTDPPIYGNLVYGLTADGTGDDSVAMFNDVGGTPNGTGGTYPQTVIAQSTIKNSFARDILLVNNRHHSGHGGKSPVFVDAFTQGQINDEGHCDPLVLGADNCPVTYVNN